MNQTPTVPLASTSPQAQADGYIQETESDFPETKITSLCHRKGCCLLSVCYPEAMLY